MYEQKKPVLIEQSSIAPRSALRSDTFSNAALIARVTLSRARSAADPLCRLRPPSPTARPISRARNVLLERPAERVGAQLLLAGAMISEVTRNATARPCADHQDASA